MDFLVNYEQKKNCSQGNIELYVNADDTIRKLLSVPLSESEVQTNNEM